MGRLSDRFGVMVPVMLGTLRSALGYVAAGYATTLWQYTLAQGLLIGAGSSATFAPLLAHMSMWFDAPARHRGRDLRQRQLPRGRRVAADRRSISSRPSAGAAPTSASAMFCVATMLPLALLLRRSRRSRDGAGATARHRAARARTLGLSPQRAAGAADRRRRRVLRRDVDAAGPPRRVLRRPGLRRRRAARRCCR